MPDATEKVQKFVDTAIDLTLDGLTADQREMLSKSLFPDTHTDTVMILQTPRLLRPTTIKVSRRLFELLKVLSTQAAEQLQNPQEEIVPVDQAQESFEAQVLNNLKAAVRVLSEFYGGDWDDVKKAVDEEDVSLYELQDVCRTQTELNSANDLFLQPLRLLIGLCKIREIATLRLENSLQITSITPPSVSDGSVPLTS